MLVNKTYLNGRLVLDEHSLPIKHFVTDMQKISINHGPFTEYVAGDLYPPIYTPVIKSKVRDLRQNCFNPSKGFETQHCGDVVAGGDSYGTSCCPTNFNNFQFDLAGTSEAVVNCGLPGEPVFACSDGIDNEDPPDGYVDYKADGTGDPGCFDKYDNDETDVSECEDGYDNDNDGYVDYPYSPGCTTNSDLTEQYHPYCFDSVDNDQDGKIDYPYDDNCDSAPSLDDDMCDDHVDTDGDDLVDYPEDLDCDGALPAIQ